MVFTGKPSAGCQGCRKRKKKCDRTTPSCKQCLAVGRVCEGIPSETDLIFRHYHKDSPPVTQRRTKKAPPPPPPPKKTPVRDLKEEPDFSLPAVPQPKPTDVAAFHFFRNAEPLLAVDPTRRNPWDGLVSFAYLQASDGSPLRFAIEAAASLRLAGLISTHELIDHAEVVYGRAIQALTRCLRDADKAVGNDVILAAHTLMITEPKRRIPGGRQRADIHKRAIEDLLERRQAHPVDDLLTEKISRALKLQMDTYKVLPLKEIQWKKGGKRDMYATSPHTEASATSELVSEAQQVEDLRIQAMHLSPATPLEVVNSVADMAKRCDARLETGAQIWTKELGWDVHSIADPLQPRLWVNCPPFFSFAALTTYYYMVRMHILTVRAEALYQLLGRSDDPRLWQVQEKTVKLINESASDICFHLPCFSRATLPSGAYYITFKYTLKQGPRNLSPFHLAYNILWVTDEQRRVLLHHMLRLRDYVNLLDSVCDNGTADDDSVADVMLKTTNRDAAADTTPLPM